ncbi:hypothetical protein PS631_05044 [Pseudomonas fluorescens]|uniref:Uncharacterized protein n=1 Tax=Pseudomonas fluorescens TaxID=294 RepID=A0A5E6WVX0_PSEFL|nr:hypothetical protein PS631_05044 [Pseudomonas fluorescens]
MRIMLAPALKPDRLELHGSCRVPSALGFTAQLQRQCDIVEHGAMGQETKVLEHHADAS